MEKTVVVIIFALVIFGSKLTQSRDVPTIYAEEDDLHEAENEVTAKLGRESSPSEDDTEVPLQLHHLEKKLQQIENMIENHDAESCQETTVNMVSSYLERKISQQKEDLKQLMDTMVKRSIKTDDDEHETLLLKIDKMGNMITQLVTQTMEATLETKFKQLENKVKKTVEEAIPGKSPDGSFGYEILQLEIDSQKAKLLQLTNQITSMNEKIVKSLANLEQLIAQNLSQIINHSTVPPEQNNRCVNNQTLKQVLFDLVIFKNTNSYYQISNRQHSCKDKAMKTSSGKYLLHPNLEEEPFVGYCEQNKFGGGWLVIQHRFNGSVDFYRGWKDYRNGFGTIDGEFWLGLETLHRLTKDKQFTLVIEIKTFNGSYAYAMYDRFEIGSEAEGYSLKRVGSYSGSASDGLKYSEGMKFTTWDSDNDQSTDNCAVDRNGAWWYKSCTFSNLNGKYQNEVSKQSLCWYVFDYTDTGLMMSRMMIREA
ncbi:fibroleukin [Aedes albopictus]|uniref:Fibrinogen C-terminal domain-containing protein n=1 Tax=Aedes albopictus TaxID=7160 RepID=A0ABM1XMM5_AEDAL